MKAKPFWMKLIVYVVVFMATIAEILPTSCSHIVFAEDGVKYEDAAYTDLVYPRRKTNAEVHLKIMFWFMMENQSLELILT